MPLRGVRRRRRAAAEGGFGLVEALAATAVVALTVAAVTGVVVSAGRGAARSAAAEAAETALRAEAARLRALPFCPPGPVAGAGGTLVGEVFPCADPGAAGGNGWYVADGSEPPQALLAALPPAARPLARAAPEGSFVTVADGEGGVALLRIAAFLAADGTPLDGRAVRGWEATGAVPPSAAALAVDLTAAGRGGAGRRAVLVFAALPAPRATGVGLP